MRIVAMSAALLFCGFLGTASADQAPKAPTAKPEEAKTQDAKVQRGQKVYADSKCSMCHSIQGKGNAKGPLDEVGSKNTPEVLRQWLINPAEMIGKTKATRKPPMPPFAKLPKEDLDALIAYLSTLKKK